VGAQPQDWREELSERLENYRKRRGHAQPDEDALGNLELDFGTPDNSEDYSSFDSVFGTPKNANSGFDMEIGESPEAHEVDGPSLGVHAREELDDGLVGLDDAAVESDMSLGEPAEKSPPLEILVGAPSEMAPAEGVVAGEIYLAPLGRRFLAGLTDTLVLMLGAAVFAIIFWRFCGRLSLVPLNIAVLGLVAVILIFAYFAVFTAVASATPGLLWMGCEIRNLSEGYPTATESCWRAFGVLVSLSALMLGFVWACVDSDGLTWHDRMSGTVITFVHSATDLAGVKVET
jgi:uncharacterized RDD family membrane protein YckC